jgi:hypothetical protein
MKAPVTILIFFILVFSSCTRYLVPAWFNHEEHSVKYSRMEYDGIQFYTEHLEVNDQHLVFDIEIRNQRPYPVEISPEKIYYLGSNVPFPPETKIKSGSGFESQLEKQFAISERGVADQFEHKMKAQRRNSILMGVLSAGLIVFDAAMDAKDFNSGDWTPKKIRNANTRDLVTIAGIAAADVVHRNSVMTAEMKREDLFFLPEEILKEINLEPGESCRGKVFFPTSRDRYIKLIIPVEYTEYAFDFRWADYEDQKRLKKSF